MPHSTRMISKGTLLVAWLLVLGVLPASAPAAGATAPVEMPDRYLLIVDISSPMRSRAKAVQESITGLLMSGMQGQLHDGDQLGIWTYSDRLHTGEFGLVVWNEQNRNEIVRSVLQFLEKQRFSGTTDFSTVMPALLDVVAHSQRITVILFSDGDETILGTPFDGAITDYFRQNAEALKEKRTPILTILRGDKGRLIRYTISYPPWPVEFPEFPPEPEPAPVPVKTNVPPKEPDFSRTLVKTNKGPIVFAEPLIVSGRKEPTRQTPDQTVQLTNRPPSQAVATNASGAAPEAPPPPVEKPPSAAPTRQSRPEPIPATDRLGESGEQHSGVPSSVKLVGLGFIALVLAGGGIFLMRRPRTRRRTSLITRSMGRRDRRR